MDWTWLLLLMCPLMMLPMMYFMMKEKHSDTDKHDHLAEELAQLKNRKNQCKKNLRLSKTIPKM